MAKLIATLFACLAGAAAAVQSAVNATLGSHLRAVPAAFTSFATGTAVLLVMSLVLWRGTSLHELGQQYGAAPLWSFTGGLLGVVMVIGMTYAVPVIGTSKAVGLFVTIQLFMSLVIDTFGLAGRAVLPLSWQQVAGALVTLLGVRLILWH